MTIKDKVSLSMLHLAHAARSAPALQNVMRRANDRADAWGKVLADWPALVEYVRRDADAIEALWYERGAR